MTTQELLEQRAGLVQAAQKVMDSCDEGRAMNADQEEKFDKLMAEADELSKQIDQRKRQESLAEAQQELAKPMRRVALAHREALKNANGSEEYHRAFWGSYIKSGNTDELRTASALARATNNIGGFTVPVTTEARIVEKLYQASIMRRLATVRQTPDDRKIPIEAALPTAAIIAENTSITQSNPTFAQKTIGAYKYATRVIASREILDDSVLDIESWVLDRSALAIARLQDDHFWKGDASGKPQGVIQGLTAAANKLQLGGSQTATITSADDIIDWIYKLPVQYRAGAVILTTDAVVAQLRKIKDAGNNYIWLASDVNTLLANGAPGTIMGIPYFITEFGAALAASAYVACYGNFRYYEIYDRGATEILVDPYSLSASWQVQMTVVRRSDAARMLDEPFMMLQMKT
jgi:HK97 family phage major capsid protein